MIKSTKKTLETLKVNDRIRIIRLGKFIKVTVAGNDSKLKRLWVKSGIFRKDIIIWYCDLENFYLLNN